MGYKILAVDDDKGIRRMVQRLLEEEGLAVVTAANGQEALELVAREAPDAVILDIAMPVMDGLTALESIRASHSAEELPVIMLTGKGEAVDVQRGEALGANLYLTKPFYPEYLLMAVAHVLPTALDSSAGP